VESRRVKPLAASDDDIEIAALAARLIAEEGLDYSAAKKRAARHFGARTPLPSNDLVEAQLREHIALFCADTQPPELQALRLEALYWMERLAAFRPHVGGAVWRGTATRHSAVLLDMYCEDPKALEMRLIDERIAYDVGVTDPGSAHAADVYTLVRPSAALRDHITTHLLVHERDALRGALKPDAQGQTWRGDATALRRLLQLAQDGSP
jgi:hypothetical protein